MDICSSNFTPYYHISLLYITKLVINANYQRSQPTPLALRHVPICGVSPSYSSSYATCLNVSACTSHIAHEDQWSGPHHTIKMLHFVLFHSVTCYTNSIVSHIHVNTAKFCYITCTLVATSSILRS